jgi:DNA-binding GntR family transcriptional regulator
VDGRRPDFFDALAQRLRERIHLGEFRPGTLLPSEAELAGAAGTKRYSIRKVLALLQAERMVCPVPGRGWLVLDERMETCSGSSSVTRYRKIAAELRTAIESGELSAGSALPSEADLVAHHGVSRATVRRALDLLESEGLIATHPGRGRFVRAR